MPTEQGTSPIVDVSWLREHRSDARVRVIDLRWSLAGPKGRELYARGHIPGAVFVDLDADISAPAGPGRHPIPSAEQFERAMRRAGVGADTHVIAYDDGAGSIASRLWWLLRHYGHESVSVLDGGFAAWTAAALPIETEVATAAEGDFVARLAPGDRVVDRAHVRDAVARPDVVLLDARAAERYRGETEPVDARPGHIPGAKSAPWAGNTEAGRFKSADALRARYEALGVRGTREVIVYCGSGVTACHDLLAMELAGLRGAKLYEGSWSDWARDASLPAAKGDG